MDNFNFNLFKYFYYVVYYKGFTNAAKNLNIVQSALSYNVKTLEEQLNKQLIIRNHKEFKLTDDGLNLYQILLPFFNNIENKVIRNISNESNYNEITIGVRHYLSDFIFKNSLSKFIQNNPNTIIRIKLYSKLDLEEFENDYDIIIDYEDYTNTIDSSNKIQLCKLNNIFVCGETLYEMYDDVKDLKELNNANLISMNPNKKNGKFQELCFKNGIIFKTIMSVNDSALCKKIIKDNIGLCFVNEEYVKEELLTGQIKKIKIQNQLFDDYVYITYKNNTKKEIINLFIKTLREQYEVEE